MSTALTVVAFVCGALALLRAAIGTVLFVRFLVRARVRSIPKGPTPPLTLLKPLYGRDPGLEENLEATLRQNYPEFEVLFLHETPDEPALEAARAAAAKVDDVEVRFVAGRDPDAANPKVALLMRGEQEARHGLIAAADADVRPDPLFLRDVANGLADSDAVSFLPVLFGMRTLGARLAALTVNTDGLLGILLAGGEAMTGATIGVRREALEAVGGFGAVADRIADDHALGEALGDARFRRTLARRAARLYTPGEDIKATLSWLLRWARTIRSAAPGWFAFGILHTSAPPLLLATALCTPRTAPALWLLALLAALRALVAVMVDLRFCWDRSLLRALPLLPLAWITEPLGLLAGLTGRTVLWRGRRYRIRGGRATLLDS